jgi:hypothetical protein
MTRTGIVAPWLMAAARWSGSSTRVAHPSQLGLTIKHRVGERHAAPACGGCRTIMDHHCVAAPEKGVGDRRPDVTDSPNEHREA